MVDVLLKAFSKTSKANYACVFGGFMQDCKVVIMSRIHTAMSGTYLASSMPNFI
jgi:hypothetical protein